MGRERPQQCTHAPMPPYTAPKTFPVTCPYPCAAPGGPYRSLGSSVPFLIVDRMEVFSSSTTHQSSAGWLAGWQPIVYSKTAARLLKAAWCLLRIATPYAVLRRLTEVAGRPAAGVNLLNQPFSVLLLRHIHFLFRVFLNYHIFSLTLTSKTFSTSIGSLLRS